MLVVLIGLFLFGSEISNAQTYPPSCTVTMPFSNAYYKAGSNIDINVYATDFGKTANNGEVTEVEFYNGDKLLGKTKKQKNYTYTYTWKKVPSGTYTIKAKATNNKGVSFTSVGVIITVGDDDVIPKGLSACKGKYLANIIQQNIPDNYDTYWIGGPNKKWCPNAYKYITERHMAFRYHAAIWASQYPRWLLELSTEDAKAAIINHMKLIAERFPLADQIDLLNEQLGNHQRDNQKFRELLGGPETTENDYDWQIWLFSEARKIFPNTKLVLNDYGMEGDPKAIKGQLELFKVLRDRGIVDGFGTQAHAFNVDRPVADTIISSIDLMATSGLPVFVTELDMNGGIRGREADPEKQLASYKKVIPAFWEHPAVAGITLWGYIEGTTWMSGTGIVSRDGVENPSMVWLKEYMAKQKNVGYPMCD